MTKAIHTDEAVIIYGPQGTEPKFCKDCVYHISARGRPDCSAPIAKNLDLITGLYRRGCYAERDSDSGSCGPDGKYFKAGSRTPEHTSG